MIHRVSTQREKQVRIFSLMMLISAYIVYSIYLYIVACNKVCFVREIYLYICVIDCSRYPGPMKAFMPVRIWIGIWFQTETDNQKMLD